MKVTNEAALAYATACEALMDERGGMLGYACATNMRRLGQAALEYANMRDDFLKAHGAPVVDDSGRTTGYSLSVQDEAYALMQEELGDIAKVEQDVDIVMIKPADTAGLAGRQVASIAWMIGGDDE